MNLAVMLNLLMFVSFGEFCEREQLVLESFGNAFWRLILKESNLSG
jgi:hypothetical protein